MPPGIKRIPRYAEEPEAPQPWTLLRALDDPNLFKPFLKDPATWQSWFAFLAALFALPMDEKQFELYRTCTGRNSAPTQPHSEAWLVCGRRAGNSFLLALIAVFASTFNDYRKYLTAGERCTVLIIATDRKQARVIFRYIRSLLLETPMLRAMVERETQDSFDLSNRVTIEIHTASFRSIRGYTVGMCLLDEISFWYSDEDSASPDTEILAALRPAMATIPNAMLLAASSPYARRGALWDAHRRHFGKDNDPILVWQAPTRTMNPTISQSIVDEAMELDPAYASAEYLAIFRTDIEAYLTREAVESCVPAGILEHPPFNDLIYSAFTDPSGGSADSMTLAIAHRDPKDGFIIVDAIRERKPPFSPEDVVSEFAVLLKTYRVMSVCGDRYGGEWPREVFRKFVISYEPCEQTKSNLYRDMLPLIHSRRVALLDHPRLISQFCSLERRTARGGRDSIEHPPGPNYHDDLSNAVAGVATLLAAKGVYDATFHVADADVEFSEKRWNHVLWRQQNGLGGWF